MFLNPTTDIYFFPIFKRALLREASVGLIDRSGRRRMAMTSAWTKAGSCFGQSDYQDLSNVVVPWASASAGGSYQAAVDVEDDISSQTVTGISQPVIGPHSSRCIGSTETFHPLSPRSFRSVSPSARRWKQIKYAGLSFRRRLNTRYNVYLCQEEKKDGLTF